MASARNIPVPKGVVQELFEERAVDLAKEQIEDIGRIDVALRNGLALVAAEGDYEKRGKEEYARAAPARAVFQRFTDRHFFDALWQQMQAEGEAGRARARLAFIGKLSKAAKDEFHRALPAIPCARIMRPHYAPARRTARRGGVAAWASRGPAENRDHGGCPCLTGTKR